MGISTIITDNSSNTFRSIKLKEMMFLKIQNESRVAASSTQYLVLIHIHTHTTILLLFWDFQGPPG